MALHDLRHIRGPKLVYLTAVIPDLCTLSTDRIKRCEENFLDLEQDHLSCFKEKIIDVELKLKEIDCKVIFATIATISFRMWNHYRLCIGRTTYLTKEEKYDDMQDRLNYILHELNSFIIERNTCNGVFTSFLHNPVQKQRKSGKIKYSYSKLIDGVHPTSELSEVWKARIVLKKNESNLIDVSCVSFF